MKTIFLNVIIFSFCFLNAVEEQPLPWQARRSEGWAWYHDYERPPEPKILEEKPKDPLIVMDLVKEELERALAKAVLEPTKDNILCYMVLQKRWINQAGDFSRLWQQNVLEHPELSSLTPTTQYGVQVKKEVDAAFKKTLIQFLAKGNALLFFYEGKSPFSQAFGKVVKEFAKQYNWPVKPISVDGVIFSNFPNTITDNSIAQEMNVNIFPALFAVDMATLKGTPLAFGMVTVSQIEENIVMQFEDKFHD